MMARRAMAAAVAVFALLTAYQRLRPSAQRAAEENDPGLVWRIGRPDHSSDEFAPGASPTGLRYTVGTSRPESDWRQSQEGAGENAPVYEVSFPLDRLEGSRFDLLTDIYFLSRSPRGLVVTVNGKRGYFPIRPAAPEKDVDERQSNTILHSRQTLRARIPTACLRAGENRIGLAWAGAGALHYDAVALRRDGAAAEEWSGAVEPTIFYKKKAGSNGAPPRLVELCDVAVRFREPFDSGRGELAVGPHKVSFPMASRGYDFGELPFRVELPAVDAPQPMTLTLVAGERRARATGRFVPEKQWRLFAGFKIHNDIGYTDIQPHIQELDNRNTDGVLDLVSRYPFYKFNFETSWLAENYLQSRRPAQTRRLLDFATQGRVGVNVLYLNVMTGLCTGEELHRALYFSYGLHKKHGVPFQFACLTDAPSHTWFVPTLLAGVGVKGFALGSNQARAPLLENSTLNEDSPFWWEGADGERVMAWYARSYLQFQRLLANRGTGEAASIERLEDTIPQFLARYRRPDYPTDAVLVYGLYTDNAEIGHGEARIVEEWNRAYEFPKIVPALDSDYYSYIARHFGERLPVRRGDGGAYWEDGAGSTARETAVNRDTQRLLPVAEMAGALAAALDPRLRYPADEFREAWKNLLFYDEHTWGANSSIRQPDKEFVTRQWEVKRSFAWRAHWAAKDLLTRSLNRLVQHIGRDGRMLYVFNPDVWPRTDGIQVELNLDQYLAEGATGREIEMDTIAERDGYRVARLLARDVPALGYRTYSVRNRPPTGPARLAESSNRWELDGRYYRLRLDPATGAIASLYDKEAGRELADGSAPFGLNQLLYVSGGENSRLLHDLSTLPLPKLEVAGPRAARLIENVRTPHGRRLKLRAEAPHIPKLEIEITLYDEIKRVDITNRLEKEEVRAKEGVYFAFPFGVSPAELDYQVQNGFARAEKDQLPGAGREWFTTQNLILARDNGITIAWATPDAPLVTLTDINRGRWSKHLELRNGHVFSYVMNNYWFTNYKAAQGGEFLFRYFITSGRELGARALARFDAETRSPLVVYPYYDTANVDFSRREAKLPMAQGSFFKVSGENVQLVAFKPAEDGHGWIVRLRETAGRPGTARLEEFAFPVSGAYLANAVEENLQPLALNGGRVEAPLKSYQYTTVRLAAGPSR